MPRQGLTLIELLVVVAILTTLVAGVIPILSPNNDARKIRETTRGLRTLLMSAQAEAARIGRPHGIGFIESSPGSGVAIEVFHVEVPPPFTGFSPDSRVAIEPIPGNDPDVYGPRRGRGLNGNGGNDFSPRLDGQPLVLLHFVLNTLTVPLQDDLLPPRFIRVGDTVEVEGTRFLIVDDYRNQDNQDDDQGQVGYLNPALHPANYLNRLVCVRVSGEGQVVPFSAQTTPPRRYRYRISRQPENAADPPFQLVAGVGIDLQASGVEGTGLNGTVFEGQGIQGSFHSEFETQNNRPNRVMILFQPQGNVGTLYFNNDPVDSVSQIMLCVGRVELGGIQDVLNTGATQYRLSTVSNADELRQVQSQVNWLNPDSRWVTILPRLGSYRTVENNFVDANKASAASIFGSQQAGAADLAANQITAARALARDGASNAGSGG